MATIINTPGQTTTEDPTSSALGIVLAIIILLVLAAFVFYYGPGLVRGVFNPTTPQVNVPGKIDVNVNKGQ